MKIWPLKISVQVSVQKYNPNTRAMSYPSWSAVKWRKRGSDVLGLAREAMTEVIQDMKEEL